VKSFKIDALIAIIVAIIGIILFTWLLVTKHLGEASYAVLLTVLPLVCLSIYGFARIRELDLKNLKLILEKAEQIKSEIAAMYGGIEHLRRAPLLMDDDRIEALGLPSGGLATATATLRYTVGCVKRERERLAQIFVNAKSPEAVAQAIVDGSMDDLVFKWNGPETPLASAPRSVAERRAAKETPPESS